MSEGTASAPTGTPRLLLLAGVTGAGKTRTAIALAERLDAELVGADSVQVVRGFDIGSAKPTHAELGGVRHHLIDVVDPDEMIDAARYAELADEAIREITARGRRVILVGGTGLWIRALIRGLVALPTPDPAVRAAVEAEIAARGAPAMHAELTLTDPRAAARIHPNDAVRIGRALEVFRQTGRALGELQDRHAKGAPRYRTLGYFLDVEPREELYVTLKARIAAMLDAGWVDEVSGLLERWGPAVRAMGSVGYRQIKEHLTEAIPLDEAQRRAFRATRIYTRRQRTWFRADPTPITVTDAAALTEGPALAAIESFFTGSTGEPVPERVSPEGSASDEGG